MLYQIRFKTRDGLRGSFNTKSSDQTQAVKHFMDLFFEQHPRDAVKLVGITEIELTGALEHAGMIEEQFLEGDNGAELVEA